MNDKSHVSMEQHVCMVCAQPFDTGALLLDRRLRASLDSKTRTGWGLCAEHRRLFDEGFVALIECDPHRSAVNGRVVRPEAAYRTGRLAHLRRDTFNAIFDVAIDPKQACVFVEPGVIEQLMARIAPPEAH